ncbi:MAG: hypothetical protein VX726_07730 [Planctomycetota bacterium]|nr:hypothetical protein [Planctomycetota bacterium]MEE2895618.1 hypothetical protein [Planctomycetota bacterium]
MKRTVPLIITATIGVLLIVANFVPSLSAWGEDATTFFAIIAAIAFVLGGGSLLKVHLKKISDRNQGWAYSLIVLGSFVIMLAIGLFKVGVPPNPAFPDKPWAGDIQGQGTAFWWVYEYVFKPLTSTMFAMLAFYIASAAFRAFRAKNFEAILLLGTAFIILLGRTAAGPFLTDWISPDGPFAGLRIEELSVYIMQVFNTAGNRAIIIGIALGIASTSLKILMGLDRSYLGGGN